MEEGIVSPSSMFYCDGVRYIAGHYIHCWNRFGCGWQDLELVHANSCNIGMIEIAEALGRELFWQYQRDFGFGAPTGIDLPGESTGIVFSMAGLNDSELATSSFGQRFTSTPIQLITGFAALINGGNIMQPHLVSRILDEQGDIVQVNNPQVQRRVISPQTSNWMRQAMASAITSGTGWAAAIEGYSQGGKTSTAEQGLMDDDNFTWALGFVGYFPVENPQYLVLSFLHEVPHEVVYYQRMNTVAPMHREIAQEIIQLRNLPPTEHVEGGATLGHNFIILEDYTGRDVVDVVSSLNLLGLNYEFIGQGGLVEFQFPAPGSVIDDQATIILNLTAREGEELIPTPDVTGLSAAFAQEILSDLGFEPMIVFQGNAYALQDQDANRIVVNQKIMGTNLPAGVPILLFVEIS